jgi:hypothetical protein
VSELPDGRLHVTNWEPRQLDAVITNVSSAVCEIRKEIVTGKGKAALFNNQVIVEEFSLPCGKHSGDQIGELHENRLQHEQEIRRRVENGIDGLEKQIAEQLRPFAQMRIRTWLAYTGREILFGDSDRPDLDNTFSLSQFMSASAVMHQVNQSSIPAQLSDSSSPTKP